MTITLYVDWDNHEILIPEALDEEIANRCVEYEEDTHHFDDWLESNYTARETFNIASRQS